MKSRTIACSKPGPWTAVVKSESEPGIFVSEGQKNCGKHGVVPTALFLQLPCAR